MAERAIWSGIISFGLVSIPVKLYAATSSKDISFNLIHASCGTRIEQKRWCPTHDREVPWEEVARAYRYGKDQYVPLTDDDFERLPLPSKNEVNITAFVASTEIDPVYFEKSYYLAPGDRGRKPYALLLRTLQDKQLVGVATITIRKKEQLCAVRPREGMILLDTLFHPDEIQLSGDIDLSDVKLPPQEVKLAHQLVEMLQRPFAPEEYPDRYREALAELIDAKLEGKEVVTAPSTGGAKVIDLREALARSLELKGKGRASPRKAGRAAASPIEKRTAPARRRTRKSTARRAG